MIKKLHHTVTMKGLMQAFGQYGGIVGCKVSRQECVLDLSQISLRMVSHTHSSCDKQL